MPVTSARHAASGYQTIYSFTGAPDGAQPEAGLLAVNGVLVGTTYGGGKSGCGSDVGCGTVFRVRSDGVERILHRFGGNPDGANPLAGLANVGGVFYGTTFGGGAAGLGSVFSVNPFGSEHVVYSFTGAPDGALPEATLLALRGTLYGTTYGGGVQGCLGSPTGCGTAFSVSTSGVEAVLHRFGIRPDGSLPISSLLYDNGTFYGTTTKRTTNEGGDACGAGLGCGVVFKMNAAGDESVLYRFLKRPDGSNPTSGLTKFNGLFYGTTPYGGEDGKGTVYLVNASGGELVVHSFNGYGDGANPFAGLTAANGFVYGTTYAGGRYGKGTVFRVDPSGTKTVVHDFAGGSDGANPRGSLVVLNGSLYGTTQFGGAFNAGTVFVLLP
jgi:uncharacterized repeat protein (TIGR03803 family)